MKIEMTNSKIHLIHTIKSMLADWKQLGYIRSLSSYCNNSTEYPYSQLRKMENMGMIRSISKSKRNKTYEWIGEIPTSLESTAQRIINGSKSRSEILKQMNIGIHRDLGNGFIDCQNQSSKYQQSLPSELDKTKLAVRITLILQRNEIPEDKIESIAKSILSLF
jgi:hypothetical protein